jgi:predicted transcriptional regulator
MQADYKIGIKTTDDFFAEALDIAGKIDTGIIPDKPIERLYFSDMKTLLQNMTPKRFELLNILHQAGALSILALSKQLKRHYKNVYGDVKTLEMLGLVEKNSDGLYIVPWDEIATTIRLAA